MTPRRSARRRVREIITSPVLTIGADASAREAAERMHGSRILHLVVVDAKGSVVGVVSDRDLRAAQPSALLVKDPTMRDKALSLMKVRDVMTAHPHTIDADLHQR